jgi:hypothetical protein
MLRTWEYLRLSQSWRAATKMAPPMEQYETLCAAVGAVVEAPYSGKVVDAQSDLLDKLGEDGWELVAHFGNPSAMEWLTFKRELPGRT